MTHWQHISLMLSKYAALIGIGSLACLAFYVLRRRHLQHAEGAKAYKDAKDSQAIEPTSLHPEIDPALCAGCGACVTACPEGQIIKLINHKAVLVNPTSCVGHGECEVACPFAAITLVFGTKKRGMELPRVSGHYETNVSGLYIAGELGGMGLIRNAIKQGKLAAEHALQQLPATKTDFDLVIVGAGAAGLAAGLVAVQSQRSYLLVEQNSFGGTVFNYPRQKVVMSQPAVLPLIGEMKFPRHKVSKEQLLAYWMQVRQRTGLKIKEGYRFLGLQQDGAGSFQVHIAKQSAAETTGTVTAKKVILAMGVRGTPRRLQLPNEDLPKVTYNLLDPGQYRGKRIVVVGGGNSAVEAAQYLAKPRYRNQISLLVRGGRLDRCNQENRDIIERMAKKNLLQIVYHAAVKQIEQEYLVIERDGQRQRLDNDFLFVLIGAELPFAFLQSLGIQIDKKFGEPVKKAT